MRSHGVVETARGLGVSDHICWTYGTEREHREFRTAAVEFAGDGLALGQRLLYVRDRSESAVLEDLDALGDLEALQRAGRVVVQHLADAFPVDRPVEDPDAQVAAQTGAIDEAIAEGFEGVRVVSENTSLATEPERRSGQVAFEQSLDRYMAGGHPLSALCGYDRRAVGDDGAAGLACVHPLRHDVGATFSLFAVGEDLHLDGEIDVVQAPWFEQALAGVPHRSPLVLDATELRFVDAAAVSVLARFAARRQAGGCEIVVVGCRAVVPRMWELLGFSAIRSLRFA